MMLRKAVAAFAVLFISAAAYGGEIYKWKDKDGRMHFSDPASASKTQINNAEKVKVIGATVTDTQRNEAEAISAQMKKHDARSPVKSQAAPVDASQIIQDIPPGDDPKSQCREEWRKYKESQDCFAPYVTARGVRGEAYQDCTELKQPTKFCN